MSQSWLSNPGTSIWDAGILPARPNAHLLSGFYFRSNEKIFKKAFSQRHKNNGSWIWTGDIHLKQEWGPRGSPRGQAGWEALWQTVGVVSKVHLPAFGRNGWEVPTEKEEGMRNYKHVWRGDVLVVRWHLDVSQSQHQQYFGPDSHLWWGAVL